MELGLAALDPCMRETVLCGASGWGRDEMRRFLPPTAQWSDPAALPAPVPLLPLGEVGLLLGRTGYSLWSFASFFPDSGSGSGLRSGGSAQIGLARARLWQHRAMSPGLPGTVSWRAPGNGSDVQRSRECVEGSR